MIKILKFEFHRMVRSKSLYASLLFALIIVIVDAHSKYKLTTQGYDVNTSVFIKWLGTFRGFEEGIYLFTVLPLLTSFVYSWTVGYDRTSGYIIQIVTRIGRKKYFLAKYIVSFISGGVVFAFSVLAHFFIISTFYPAYYPLVASRISSVAPFSFCSELFYSNPYLFVLTWTGVTFLWGGSMVCIAIGVGMLTRKYSISVIVPFLAFTVQPIIATYINLRYEILINKHSMGIIWLDMLYAAPLTTNYVSQVLLNIAAVAIIPSIIYAIRGHKYECL